MLVEGLFRVPGRGYPDAMESTSAFFTAAGIDETPELRQASINAVMAVLCDDLMGVAQIAGQGNARSAALGSA